MRLVIQRVKQASVTVDGKIVGQIQKGLLVLVGTTEGDTKKSADYLADKVVNLRIFEDEAGKMNCSAKQLGYEVLVVSQFTLYGDCRKGRRPSFIKAQHPEPAKKLYDYFLERLNPSGIKIQAGIFGASMDVMLINWGPVTLLLDTEKQI